MTTTVQHRPPLPVIEKFRMFLDSISALPAFSSAVVPEEFQRGYSASRNDIAYAVDSEVTDMLSVYEVLDVANSLFEPAALGRFFTKRVPGLDNRTPLNALMEGDAAQVLALLASEYEGQVR
jgi:hypothetical protein